MRIDGLTRHRTTCKLHQRNYCLLRMVLSWTLFHHHFVHRRTVRLPEPGTRIVKRIDMQPGVLRLLLGEPDCKIRPLKSDQNRNSSFYGAGEDDEESDLEKKDTQRKNKKRETQNYERSCCKFTTSHPRKDIKYNSHKKREKTGKGSRQSREGKSNVVFGSEQNPSLSFSLSLFLSHSLAC